MTGGDLFECLGQTHTAVAGWILAFAYFTTTGLLLLNMLIAMMAKTFESISDSSSVNYQLLLAQSTMSMHQQATASAPLNLLTLPYDIFIGLHEIMASLLRPQVTPEDQQATATPRGDATTFHTGERAMRAMFLTTQVDKYLREHMDGIIQEGRWRAVLSRDMAGRHRRVIQKLDQTDRAVAQIYSLLRAGRSKGDRTHAAHRWDGASTPTLAAPNSKEKVGPASQPVEEQLAPKLPSSRVEPPVPSVAAEEGAPQQNTVAAQLHPPQQSGHPVSTVPSWRPAPVPQPGSQPPVWRPAPPRLPPLTACGTPVIASEAALVDHLLHTRPGVRQG